MVRRATAARLLGLVTAISLMVTATPANAAPDCTQVKCIALTFDDGPATSTNDLLAILERKDAKATFFMLGVQLERFPKTARRVARADHAIGLHSYSHPDLTELSTKKIRRQIVLNRRLLREVTGRETRMLRPPYGATGPRVHRLATNLGLAEILWDVDPRDWEVRNTKRIVKRVVNNAHPGAIVVMHDIRPTTVAAVGPIIRKLRERGFVFVTVPQILPSLKPGKVYYSGIVKAATLAKQAPRKKKPAKAIKATEPDPVLRMLQRVAQDATT